MTTVDVDIQRLGGRERISLHNGLFGPATTVQSAALAAYYAGTVPGEWDDGGITVTVTGGDLRTILAKVGTLVGPYHAPEDNDRLQRFRGAIDDDASYTIHAIEF
jgi:hypothetical protein